MSWLRLGQWPRPQARREGILSRRGGLGDGGRVRKPVTEAAQHLQFPPHVVSQCAKPREGRSRRDVLLAVLKKTGTT